MATNNSVNISAAGLVRYDGAGTFTGVTVTNHSPLIGAASNGITSLGPLTDGQLIIGSTGADPSAAGLTAGTGISIATGAGSITINSTGAGGGIPWTEVVGTSQAAAINNGYLTNNVGLVTVTLPATAAQFSVIAIVGKGSGGWLIAQNANQKIIFGNTATTVGVAGSLASTNANDCVYLLATTGGASTFWTVLNSVGNITVA